MTPNNSKSRALQQDARAWSGFTGIKYTAALRQMSSPLAQGFLGERVRRSTADRRARATTSWSARMAATSSSARTVTSRNLRGASTGKTDFIQLALITDMLRMFTPISGSSTPEVGSYSLKHTAEWFLSPHCSYVSNGRLIWAAAAMDLPITVPDGGGPNLLIGVSEREHDYVRRMVGSGQTRPQADHYRPAGYEHLRASLAQAAAGELITKPWVRPTPFDEPAPFHNWLILQVGRNDIVGDLAGDYSAGIRDSDHRIARTADELLAIFHEVSHSPEAYDAVVISIAEWMRTEPSAAPIRTEPVGGDAHDHGGWGAGGGTVERYMYLCPCGDGTIIEEHDNIPGFREHDVRIDCGKCHEEWRFVEGRGVRDWALQPVSVSARA